jgi:hypothetical protein
MFVQGSAILIGSRAELPSASKTFDMQQDDLVETVGTLL